MGVVLLTPSVLSHRSLFCSQVPITSSVTGAPILQGDICNNIVTQVTVSLYTRDDVRIDFSPNIKVTSKYQSLSRLLLVLPVPRVLTRLSQAPE